MHDRLALTLQDDLTAQIVRHRARGVLIDISALEMVDSFIGRMLGTIASMARMLDAETVVVGMQPSVAITLVELGLSLKGIRTALDVEKGMATLQTALSEQGGDAADERYLASKIAADPVVRGRRHRSPGGAKAGGRIGLQLVDQTKFVTAASELARNTLDYGGGGQCKSKWWRTSRGPGVRLIFEDQGPGIPDIELALKDGYTPATEWVWVWAAPNGFRMNSRSRRSRAKARGSRYRGGNSGGPRRSELPLKTRARRRSPARRRCRWPREIGFDAERAGQVAIVVTEACTNILKHAGRARFCSGHRSRLRRRGPGARNPRARSAVRACAISTTVFEDGIHHGQLAGRRVWARCGGCRTNRISIRYPVKGRQFWRVGRWRARASGCSPSRHSDRRRQCSQARRGSMRRFLGDRAN